MAYKRLYALADILFAQTLAAEKDLKYACDNGQADTDRGNVLLGRVEALKNVIKSSELTEDYDDYKDLIKRRVSP